MTNIDEIFTSGDYIKTSDLKGRDVNLRITEIEIREYQEKDGTSKRKPILSFDGTDKRLVCNKTNAYRIAEAFGTETANWKGQVITLYPDRVEYQGKIVDGIRVRMPTTTLKPAAKSATPLTGLDDEIPF